MLDGVTLADILTKVLIIAIWLFHIVDPCPESTVHMQMAPLYCTVYTLYLQMAPPPTFH